MYYFAGSDFGWQLAVIPMIAIFLGSLPVFIVAYLLAAKTSKQVIKNKHHKLVTFVLMVAMIAVVIGVLAYLNTN